MASTIIGPLVSIPAQNNSTWTLRSADIGDYIGRKARLVIYHASGPAYDGDIQLDDFNIGGNTFDPESGTHYFETNRNQDNTQNVNPSSIDSDYSAVEWVTILTDGDTHTPTTDAGRFWRDASGTPSGNTGNTSGNTGSYYYFAENSYTGTSNDVWLRSRIVTVDSSTLSFYSAQNGANCGAIYAYLEVFDEGVSVYGATNYGDGYYSKLKIVSTSGYGVGSYGSSLYGDLQYQATSSASSSASASAEVIKLGATVASQQYDPEDGLTLSGSLTSGTISGSFTSRTQNIVLSGEVALPAIVDDQACLFEHGGAGSGTWLGLFKDPADSKWKLRFRSSDGADTVQVSTSNTAIANVAIEEIPEFDNQVHTVTFEMKIAAAGRIRLWIDGRLVIEEYTLGGALEGNTWSGGDNGGWGTGVNSIAGIVNYQGTNTYQTDADWPYTPTSNLRYYANQLVSSNDSMHGQSVIRAIPSVRKGSSASLSGSLSASVSAQVIKQGSSSQGCTSSTSAQAFLTASRSASTTANSTVDGLGLRIGIANSIVVNTSGIVTTAQRIQQPSASDSASSDTSANGQGTFARSASLSANSSTSSSAEIIRLGVSNEVSATSSTTASGDAAIAGSASTSCASTVSSSGLRIGESSGIANGTASGTASANYTIGSATATSSATVSIDLLGERIARAESIVVNTSGVVTSAEVIQLSGGSISVSSSSASSGLKIQQESASTSSTSTFDSSAILVQQGSSQAGSSASTSSYGEVVYLASVSDSAVSATASNAELIQLSSSEINSNADSYANAQISASGSSAISLSSSASSSGSALRSGVASMSGQALITSFGRYKYEQIDKENETWAVVPQGNETWTDVAKSDEIWTEVA